MTEKGVTVTLNHDTQLPRPYSDSGDTKIPPMVQRLQGTEGIFFGSLEKIHIDGRSPCTSGKIRLPITNSTNIFCGRRLGEAAKSSSHVGEDYVELHQFVRAVRNRMQIPVDVYDVATWSVIIPLSEQSVASRSAAVDFPDFTRGKWETRGRSISGFDSRWLALQIFHGFKLFFGEGRLSCPTIRQAELVMSACF